MSCPITAGCRSRSRTSPEQPADQHQHDKLDEEDGLGRAVAGLIGRAGGRCARDKDRHREENPVRDQRHQTHQVASLERVGNLELRASDNRTRPRWFPRQCNCKLFATSISVVATETVWCRRCWFVRPRVRFRPSPLCLAAGVSARQRPSLAEVFGTIATKPTGSFWRKLTSFLGPGYLVAVGYMDPGNWATSLAGGSKFGYALLTVALLSNLMAILLQALVRAAWHRRRPRSGAGLPRRVSPRGVVAALGAGGDRDLRHRPCRGDRHRDRAQSVVRHSARNRRADHRARRVPHPVDAEPGLPLDRGLHRHACSASSRCASCDPDRDGRSRMGRGDHAASRRPPRSCQSRHALSRASASSAPP